MCLLKSCIFYRPCCVFYKYEPSLCSDGEVPGSAVLVFDVEMIEMEEGLPEGYMFVWNGDVTPDLFNAMDKNKDKEVERSEVKLHLFVCLHAFNSCITKVFNFSFRLLSVFRVHPPAGGRRQRSSCARF